MCRWVCGASAANAPSAQATMRCAVLPGLCSGIGKQETPHSVQDAACSRVSFWMR